MPLELINTLSSVATTLIIAATAIAAIVQLRHLRASNQIGLQLAIHQTFIDREFWAAVGRARFGLPALVEDSGFADFVRRYHQGLDDPGDERFEETYESALVVGRTFENIGNMVRNGLADKEMFFEQFAPLVSSAWNAVEPMVRLRRTIEGSDLPWEDFEYLTVLARRWLTEHGSIYPAGMERIIPPTAS